LSVGDRHERILLAGVAAAGSGVSAAGAGAAASAAAGSAAAAGGGAGSGGGAGTSAAGAGGAAAVAVAVAGRAGEVPGLPLAADEKTPIMAGHLPFWPVVEQDSRPAFFFIPPGK
jgi:hypothetical protein